MLGLFSVRRRWQFVLVLILTLIGALAELISIGSVLPFLELVAAPNDIGRLPGGAATIAWVRTFYTGDLVIPAASLMIASAVLSAVVRIVLTWATSRLVFGLTHDLSMMVYSRVIRQLYSTYIQRNSSEVLAGIEKVNTIGGFLLNALMTALSSVIIAFGIIVLLVLVNPTMAVIAGGMVLLLYAVMGLFSRSLLLPLGRRQAALSTARIKLLQETLGGVRDIILDQSHRTFEWHYRQLDAETRRLSSITNFVSLSPRYVVEGAGIALIALFAVFYSSQPGGVLAAVPALGALALGAQRLLPLAQNINIAWAYYVGTAGLVEDMFELLDAPAMTLPPVRLENPTPFRHGVALEGLGFGYDADRMALTGIDLSIPKGARIGIIGHTGSGKTTLLDVLMGLLEPTHGRIVVDGVPLSAATLENWQAQIAHVPQSIFLLDGTIAGNIAFGTPDEAIDMARVRAAAQRADVAEFVERLPEGYKTVVGERGVRLSGGQRQRLGIARALYKRATVLILDEATSALDDATETAVMAGIEQLDRDLTILMIAHRLTTVAQCDVIVRLEHGRIVAQGSFADVVGAGSGAATAGKT